MTAIVPEQGTALGPHRRELEVILASAPARAAAVVACAVSAATSGAPLHVHAAADEIFFILSWELLVHADGQVATIREGGLVHVSHGMPHVRDDTRRPGALPAAVHHIRPDPMTAALAGRHRHAGTRRLVNDSRPGTSISTQQNHRAVLAGIQPEHAGARIVG
jgi:mannose-6-phosphate isomerase-like protein (cupin superfamily)